MDVIDCGPLPDLMRSTQPISFVLSILDFQTNDLKHSVSINIIRVNAGVQISRPNNGSFILFDN